MFSDENTAQAPLICRRVWRQMSLPFGQPRIRNQSALALGLRQREAGLRLLLPGFLNVQMEKAIQRDTPS